MLLSASPHPSPPEDSPGSRVQSPGSKAEPKAENDPRESGAAAPDVLPDRFFRHLVFNLRNGVLAITRDGRIAAMNSIAYRVLGLQPRQTDLGRSYLEVLQDCPEVVRIVQSAFETSDLPNRAELRLRKSGRAIGYTISKIHDDSRAEVGLTLFVKDLTRVEQIEERQRLRDRLATLGGMAATIAHEVKNPLASIEIMAGTLRRQLKDRPEAMETLSEIIKESKLANSIVVEVLEFVRPIRLQVEPVVVGEVVRDAIDTLELGASQVQVDVDKDVPELMADASQLRQLLTNLITNAIEAMEPEGTVYVRVSHVAEDAELASAGQPMPAQVTIEVRDQGIGISEGDLERIFSPFFTTKPKGTGLGLSIVRKVVDAHDGIIEAASAPGRGTTFRVTLPVVKAGPFLQKSIYGTHSRR
ncbi:MAG TPA: ATP-binding protein [Vicinamibacterales bacterium]|nr:ATP-binding protein [Vicinamibacterales bacterium]